MEIDWGKIAEMYELTQNEFEKQIFISASVCADMNMGGNEDKRFIFTCEQPEYKLELTVRRINL
ncbi:MAG: hypothetical protein QM504_08135 [Pseudomonadota bacterium]